MNKERLLKLATHLESGKLMHDNFCYATYHLDLDMLDRDELIEYIEQYSFNCGTVGCAIGECIAVFPNEWELRRGDPVLKSVPHNGVKQSGMDFFELDTDEYCHLFVPGCQETEEFGGFRLTGKATKEQVAANIRTFVAKMESEPAQ